MPWNDSDRLTENVNMASQYTTYLKEQIDPLAKDLITKITKGADMLREHIEVEVSTVWDVHWSPTLNMSLVHLRSVWNT